MTSATDIPVLIAGGGPVGTTLALDLAYRGVSSIVVEERLAMPPNPKCNTTNARSMEHFRRLGCADAIRRVGLPLDRPTDVVYATRWVGKELTRYRLRSSQEVLAQVPHCGAIDDHWPTPEPQHRVSQLAMEPVLRAHTGVEAPETSATFLLDAACERRKRDSGGRSLQSGHPRCSRAQGFPDFHFLQ